MADELRDKQRTPDRSKEPEGLGDHARGPASEAAHEQGWDLNEDERKQQPQGRPAHYGGKGYDYGAQDFGDTPAKRDNPGGASNEPGQSPGQPDERAVERNLKKDLPDQKDRKAS